MWVTDVGTPNQTGKLRTFRMAAGRAYATVWHTEIIWKVPEPGTGSVGAAKADRVPQLAQKPAEGEVELEAKPAALLVDNLFEDLVDIEGWV